MTSPENNTTTVSRKLMGFATSFNPEELFATLYVPYDSPLPLANLATRHIIDSAMTTGTLEDEPNRDVRTILGSGIDDIHTIAGFILRGRYGVIARPDAVRVFRDPETIASIAAHARLPERTLKEVLARNEWPHELNDRTLLLGDDWTSVVLTPAFEETQQASIDTGQGCPFAKSDRREQGVDPLFARFAAWAGELSVHSLYRHQESATDPSIVKV